MSSPVKSLSWWAENSVFWNHHASSRQLSTWQTCLRPLRSPWTTHGVVFRELGNVIWPIYCHMWPHGARPHSGLSFRLRPCRLVWRGHLLWKHRAGLNRQCVKPAPNKSKSKPAGKHWPTGATLMFILNFSSLFWAFPFPASCICSCLWLLRSCAVNLSHWRLYFSSRELRNINNLVVTGDKVEGRLLEKHMAQMAQFVFFSHRHFSWSRMQWESSPESLRSTGSIRKRSQPHGGPQVSHGLRLARTLTRAIWLKPWWM